MTKKVKKFVLGGALRSINPIIKKAAAQVAAKPAASMDQLRAAKQAISGNQQAQAQSPKGATSLVKPSVGAAQQATNASSGAVPRTQSPLAGKTIKQIGGIGAALGKRMGMKKGGSVSSASKRADGCATKGKTKGRMV
jgi:hypothetical protein